METVNLHDEPKGLFDDDDDDDQEQILATAPEISKKDKTPAQLQMLEQPLKQLNGEGDTTTITNNNNNNNIVLSSGGPVSNGSDVTSSSISTGTFGGSEKGDADDETTPTPTNASLSASLFGQKSINDQPPVTSSVGHAGTGQTMSTDETIDIESKVLIDVNGYDRRGEGMNSYYVFKVVSKPLPGQSVGFVKKEYDVWRRFSDFLGLHEKLAEKHLPNGILIPQAPDKDVIASTKTKMAKTSDEDATTSEFLERRRATLERFLRRCALHPSILLDPDFRDFLTLESDLPRSSQTAALSGPSVMRLLGKVSSTLTKMNVHIEESDTWFQDKMAEIDELDEQLKKLHYSFETLIYHRKECASSIDAFCKSLSLLAACEDNTSLSKALAVLSESMEKVGAQHQDQSDKDLYLMAENLKDYLGLIVSIRDIFQERVKAWQAWQTAQLNLTRKRETKVRMEIAGKTDRISSIKKEIQECESKVQECEDQFDKLNRIIRRELKRFDVQRVQDFKLTMIRYLESLADTQGKLVKHWEAFLPNAKGIVC